MLTLSQVRQTHNWCNEKFDQLSITNQANICHDLGEKEKEVDDAAAADDDDDDDTAARWKMKLVWLTRARWDPVEPN